MNLQSATMACAVTCWVAAFSRDRALMGATVAFVVGWIWYNAAWWALNPAQLIYDVSGADIPAHVLWAAGDAAVGFFIFTVGWPRTWSVCLLALYAGSIPCHFLYASTIVQWTPYRQTLDAVFVIQVLCLICAGIKPHVLRWLARRDARRMLGVGSDPIGGAAVPEPPRRIGASGGTAGGTRRL